MEKQETITSLAARCQVDRDEWLDYTIHYVTTAEQLDAAQAWAVQQERIALDIETDGRSKDGLNHLSKKIATIQVGNPEIAEPVAYVICARSFSDARVRSFLEAIAGPGIVKLGQNIRFELTWLTHKYGVLFDNVACTQIAELNLRAGLFPTNKTAGDEGLNRKCYTDTSMFRLCSRYLGLTIDKSEEARLEFWVTPPKQLSAYQLEYAAGDVIYPFYLLAKQRQEIRNRGLSEIIKIEFALIPVLVDSELYGVRLNQPAWLALYQEALQQKVDARDDLDRLFLPQSEQVDVFGAAQRRPTQGSKEVNYDAPVQARNAFVTYCKSKNWPVEIITSMKRLLEVKAEWGKAWLAKRPDKTADDVPQYLIPEDRYIILIKFEGDTLRLGRIRKQLPAILVETYLRYKEAAKRASTYGVKFLDHVGPDGQIHTYWHQSLTTTGRLSSAPNLQNIDRDSRYRACFIPKAGNKFLIFDYSSIEPRISAEVSQDPVYVQTFLDNADIYCRVGEAMSGQPIDKKRDKMLRTMFKAVVLALAYNMGPGKLRDAVTLNMEEFILDGSFPLPTFDSAKQLWDRFFAVHQGLRTYQNQCIAYATPDPADAPEGFKTRPKLWDAYLQQGVTWATSPCGRKRFFDQESKTTYTESPNSPIQGCSATILKLAAVLLWHEFRRRGWSMHICVYAHDEFVIEVPEAIAEVAAPVARQCMEDAARRYVRTVPVIAEPAQGIGVCDVWIKD